MSQNLDRRQFLSATGAALTIAATGTSLISKSAAAKSLISDDEPTRLFDISLAEWSLHRNLRQGKLDNLDFPKVAKEEFGIDGVEYVNQFFKNTSNEYVADLKKRCGDHGVKSVLIMVDGEGKLGAETEDQRKQTVENHFKWVAAAKELGCHSIRVNAASSGNYQEQVGRAADGLAKLSEHAQTAEIGVIVENHGGLSSNGQWLAQVIRKVNMDNCGTLPDFGNFRLGKDADGKEILYDRYMGVSALMPFAKAVSAKSHDFDENGQETRTDYLKMMQIVLDAGYHGYVGVEYEGGKLDEYEGIRATKKLLEKVHAELLAKQG